ncbi:serine/threonine-protein kinase HipA [Dyadobacter sp. SG02]|uniref:HipA N-terminal domain-containing protein n=1 Tax=Dyadobacter sp. SG02 TaxID=1855291 RepID=UPI0008D0C028|nr:HipA N-terminal domain-containing protein [Dyadobacter sp. SG02]SEJ73456.1 serine/threonine-protein kinase HipA [Dyadobacter sp. SG02]
MRSASIYYDQVLAGTLMETDEGLYTFAYHSEYVHDFPDQYLTFSMPVTEKVYMEKRLFPFFEGLIPEGWLLDIASKSWKVNPNDRMGLLLACCENCIGAVSVIPDQHDDE